jgi:hypothetical protein
MPPDIDERGIPATEPPIVYTAAASKCRWCPRCETRLNKSAYSPWCGACGWVESEQKASRR